MKKVKKAVIAAAGNSTRFLPAAKNIPKQILPLIDVPIIHELVKECIDSEINQIIIVTRQGDNAIEEYFGNNYELEDYLRKTNKMDRYERFNEVYDKADIAYVKQSNNLPYGNATPALAAKPFLSPGESFAYFYADDVVLSKEPAIKQVMDKYYSLSEKDPNIGCVLAAQEVSKEQLCKLSSIDFVDMIDMKIRDIIEKPEPGEEFSNFTIYGRFVVDYSIFDYLENKYVRKGELWWTDALQRLSAKMNLYGCKVNGNWMTTGDPVNYLKTLIAYALTREEVKKPLMEYIQTYCPINKDI